MGHSLCALIQHNGDWSYGIGAGTKIPLLYVPAPVIRGHFVRPSLVPQPRQLVKGHQRCQELQDLHCRSCKHTACTRSQRHLEQPSFAKGFLTGLWQVWEKRSAQFSTVPLSKTASSLLFWGKQAVQVFQGEKGGYEMV